MLPDDSQVVKKQTPPVSSPPIPTSPISLPPGATPVGGGIIKEKELIQKQEESYIEEIGKELELELEKEVEEAGVEKIGEEINLPESTKEMGVEETGPGTPISPGTSLGLPLTQIQIKKALHKRIVDSILWLAYWCLRQLKIAKIRNKT